MKAWVVTDKDSYEGGSAVVFAETPGKAKAKALKTQVCVYADFTRITCRRMPDADKFYHGQGELDWADKDVRVFLVRDHGWWCLEVRDSECDVCPAKKFCRGEDEVSK